MSNVLAWKWQIVLLLTDQWQGLDIAAFPTTNELGTIVSPWAQEGKENMIGMSICKSLNKLL